MKINNNLFMFNFVLNKSITSIPMSPRTCTYSVFCAITIRRFAFNNFNANSAIFSDFHFPSKTAALAIFESSV